MRQHEITNNFNQIFNPQERRKHNSIFAAFAGSDNAFVIMKVRRGMTKLESHGFGDIAEQWEIAAAISDSSPKSDNDMEAETVIREQATASKFASESGAINTGLTVEELPLDPVSVASTQSTSHYTTSAFHDAVLLKLDLVLSVLSSLNSRVAALEVKAAPEPTQSQVDHLPQLKSLAARLEAVSTFATSLSTVNTTSVINHPALESLPYQLETLSTQMHGLHARMETLEQTAISSHLSLFNQTAVFSNHVRESLHTLPNLDAAENMHLELIHRLDVAEDKILLLPQITLEGVQTALQESAGRSGQSVLIVVNSKVACAAGLPDLRIAEQ
ncbi:hypothetical protein BC830DRAFT_1076644 [Chytriomyces sp. MP71]|nr:hypothetical protein BC830DRAFT_1076644 [Chytriomyces sp. MP71]